MKKQPFNILLAINSFKYVFSQEEYRISGFDKQSNYTLSINSISILDGGDFTHHIVKNNFIILEVKQCQVVITFHKLDHHYNNYNLLEQLTKNFTPILDTHINTNTSYIINHVHSILSKYKQGKLLSNLINYEAKHNAINYFIRRLAYFFDNNISFFNSSRPIHIYRAVTIAKNILEKSEKLILIYHSFIDSNENKTNQKSFGMKTKKVSLSI